MANTVTLQQSESVINTESLTSALSKRQIREREYYEAFSRLTEPGKITFAPVEGKERRPWNSRWLLYELIQNLYHSPGQKLLDFGCGNGSQAMRYAYIGYEVHGFDCCDNNIAIAKRLAKRYGYGDTTDFSIQVAEKLTYPDNTYDVVAGTGILHHVEVEAAVREAMRVLKPGGTAFFWEPLVVPAFDRIRNSRIGKMLVPNESSLDKNITQDERKLNAEDITAVKKVCEDVELRRFVMFSRFNRFLAGPRLLPAATLEKVDQFLFRAFPFLERFGGVGIFILRK